MDLGGIDALLCFHLETRLFCLQTFLQNFFQMSPLVTNVLISVWLQQFYFIFMSEGYFHWVWKVVWFLFSFIILIISLHCLQTFIISFGNSSISITTVHLKMICCFFVFNLVTLKVFSLSTYYQLTYDVFIWGFLSLFCVRA